MAAWPIAMQVVVVSHWGFIRCLTGQKLGNGAMVRSTDADLIPPAGGDPDMTDQRTVGNGEAAGERRSAAARRS